MVDSILVTGGSGLVGKALMDIVKNEPGWKFLSSKDCDLLCQDSTKKLFSRVHPTKVVHLAAKVGGLYANISNNTGFFIDNMKMNINVLENCNTNDVKQVISCLSTCVFPDFHPQTRALNENDLHKGEPHSSNFGYAYAKRMIQVMSMAFNQDFDRNYNCIIPTNIFGPHDNFSLENGHVVPALIHKCYLAKLNNTDFVVRGDGRARRQFVFSKDLARFIHNCINNDLNFDTVLFSSECEYSIKEVVNMIVDIFQYQGEVKYDKSFQGGQHSKTVSNAKLKKIIPEITMTPVHKALEETISWFISNYETCRK